MGKTMVDIKNTLPVGGGGFQGRENGVKLIISNTGKGDFLNGL